MCHENARASDTFLQADVQYAPRPIVASNGPSTLERLAVENDRLQAQFTACLQQNQALMQQVQKANQEARTATEFAKMLCNQQRVNPTPW